MITKNASKKSTFLHKSKQKISKKAPITEHQKKISQIHIRKAYLTSTKPRTCVESPIGLNKKQASKRLKSCETLRIASSFKIGKKAKKRTKSKEKLKGKVIKINTKTYDIQDMPISPIKKLKLNFLNLEDQSMLKALDII